MYSFDANTLDLLTVNNAALQHYGYSRDEFLNLKIIDLELNNIDNLVKEKRQGEQLSYFIELGRHQQRRKDGSVLYIRLYIQETFINGRRIKQILALDIEKKINTEKSLYKKSAELEQVLESMNEAFFTLDNHWKFTYVNSEFERIQRISRIEILGQNIWDFFPHFKYTQFECLYKSVSSEHKSFKFEEIDTANNIWLSVNAYPIDNGLAVYFRDITIEKETREKIYKNEQNIRAIINNTSDLIWSVDQNLRIITANQAFWEIAADTANKIYRGIQNEEFQPLFYYRYQKFYQQAFEGHTFHTVQKNVPCDGNSRYEQLSFNPIFDQHEKVVGVNCFLRDITDQQQYLERIEKQNQRLKDIAWTQSHRVRAPLANILGLVQFIEPVHTNEDPQTAEIINKLKISAEELDLVIKDISRLTNEQQS